MYDNVRRDLFIQAEYLNNGFSLLSDFDKLCFLLSSSEISAKSAKTCKVILTIRCSAITHYIFKVQFISMVFNVVSHNSILSDLF